MVEIISHSSCGMSNIDPTHKLPQAKYNLSVHVCTQMYSLTFYVRVMVHLIFNAKSRPKKLQAVAVWDAMEFFVGPPHFSHSPSYSSPFHQISVALT